MEPRPERRPKTAMLIGVALILAGLVLAVGVGSVMVLRRAQGESFRFPVGPDLPFAPGDVVSLEREGGTCDAVVLTTLSNGDLRVAPCDVRADPIDVSRTRLFLDAYRPDLGSAAVGDVVLVRAGLGWERARVVALESEHRVRVRPIRVAPDRLGPPGPDRVVAEREALGVQRVHRGPDEVWGPVGAIPLAVGDRLRWRSTEAVGSIPAVAIVLRLSGARVFVQRRIGDADDGAPIEVDPIALEARILRPRDAIAVGDVLVEPGADGSFRRVTVARAMNDRTEVCVTVADEPCHELPVTGVVRIELAGSDLPGSPDSRAIP